MKQFGNTIVHKEADKMMQVLNYFLFSPQIRYAIYNSSKLTNSIIDAVGRFMLVCSICMG